MSALGSYPHMDAEEDDLFHEHTNYTTPEQPSWSFASPYQPDYALRADEDEGTAIDWFNNQFRTAPSPAQAQPQLSFLDNILNPVETDSFGNRLGDNHNNNMSSSRGQGRPAHLSNGYVDLTNDASDVTTASRKTKRESPTPGPSTKRLRRSDRTASKADDASPEATVEEIDLSDDKQTVQDVLQKQREEAVKAQAQPEDGEKPTSFNTFNCVICMDTPTDLTATACGHLFCHTCLMEALIAGENRGGPGEPRRSQCPVCRKNINRTKTSDIIPLLLKKGLSTQPRKTRPIGTNTATATASKVTS